MSLCLRLIRLLLIVYCHLFNTLYDKELGRKKYKRTVVINLCLLELSIDGSLVPLSIHTPSYRLLPLLSYSPWNYPLEIEKI